MSFFQAHPDPQIASIVSELTSQLRRLSEQPNELLAALQANRPLPTGDLPEGQSPDELYQIAARLCDAGEFAHALPIALHLAGRPEREARYAFLAGSCLQRLDHPHVALGMFGLSTINEAESPTPGPLLRSGECLAAMGLNDRAIEAFEAAVEIARSDSEYAQLQDIALEKAALLRNAH
ncbi:hypothetical protein [Variovorax sp. RA8]|uniref:hypothetical protein n=1 Tax=Variovorax sp. (strain JCM 16519 / RA8) TaxID=662548 RepID=UPI0013170980|nr:hypothetical protein [Variovorax sp. RA8]VTU14702.1 type III secretion low calcium response chaperone LcrH/SycD [Variovorax sp. RA8]